MPDEIQTIDRTPAVIEVRLNDTVVATCAVNSAIRDVSRALGIEVMPLVLRKIADQWEKPDAR